MIQSLRVAFVTYVVTVLASSLAVLFFVADGAFHQLIIFQVLQRRTANQAFFVHRKPQQIQVCRFYSITNMQETASLDRLAVSLLA